MKWNGISLKTKLIFCILLAEIILLSVSSVVIISSVTEQQEELTTSNCIELCKIYAEGFDGDFRRDLAIARTLSATMTVYETKDRKEVITMLKEVLAKNDHLVAVYVGYERNRFDGKDDEYVNTAGHDETGRFMPYVTKNQTAVRVEPLYGYDEMEYYQVPSTEKRDALTNPIYYDDIFVLSIVSPIFENGDFIGIAGVDLPLDYVNTTINDIQVFDTGYAYMISNNGMFLSHPTDSSYIGSKGLQDMDDPLFRQAADNIKNGLSGQFRTKDPLTGKDVNVFYEPIPIDNSSIMLVVPVNEMMANVYDLTYKLIVIFVISILVIVGVTYLLASSIMSSVERITDDLRSVLQNVADGKFETCDDKNIAVDFRPIPESINRIIETVRDQIHETKRVSRSLENGNLRVRPEMKLSGEFKDVADALSDLSGSLDEIIGDSSHVLNSIRQKDFSQPITHYGKGDFLRLTYGIEQTRVDMQKITEQYEKKEKELLDYTESLRLSNIAKAEMERIINNSPVIALLLRIDSKWPVHFISENVSQWGYSVSDFMDGKVTYFDIIHPDDYDGLFSRISQAFFSNEQYLTDEFRIITKSGEVRWIEARLYLRRSDNKFTDLYGVNLDITERKEIEQQAAKVEDIRKKEIHHRIKNNLQVISMMLYLESSKFTDPEILQAFKDSQNRVKSMALIHEELYKGGDLQTINFNSYVKVLTENIYNSYKTGNKKIFFDLNIEDIFLDLETAIPIGTIINELVTNSMKYAFRNRKKGRIFINMTETVPNTIRLEVGDDGEEDPALDLYDEDRQSLGIQLVTALVEQLDGTITLELAHGTRYRIIFRVNPRSRTSLFKRYVKGVILYLKTLHFIFFMISDEGYSDFPYIRKIYFSIYPAIHLQYLHPESSSCI
ncbi:MAG: PAS domain-containing protein [Methanosarcinaceae archaeon]|nr:PAS domain-containing protein [Methanosarcinaceae archaeon]